MQQVAWLKFVAAFCAFLKLMLGQHPSCNGLLPGDAKKRTLVAMRICCRRAVPDTALIPRICTVVGLCLYELAGGFLSNTLGHSSFLDFWISLIPVLCTDFACLLFSFLVAGAFLHARMFLALYVFFLLPVLRDQRVTPSTACPCELVLWRIYFLLFFNNMPVIEIL